MSQPLHRSFRTNGKWSIRFSEGFTDAMAYLIGRYIWLIVRLIPPWGIKRFVPCASMNRSWPWGNVNGNIFRLTTNLGQTDKSTRDMTNQSRYPIFHTGGFRKHPVLLLSSFLHLKLPETNFTMSIKVGEKIPEGTFKYVPYTPDLENGVSRISSNSRNLRLIS